LNPSSFARNKNIEGLRVDFSPSLKIYLSATALNARIPRIHRRMLRLLSAESKLA
jgi:hypothetical protein